MKTDKQIFKIFQAVPEWIFELTGLESPGKCVFRSFTVKSLERVADGLVVPDDPNKPLTVVEVQFQKDEMVYTRTVVEMAAAQEAHGMREVQGVILFRYNGDDPKTPPWSEVVRSCLLRDVLKTLEDRHPHHPLVAVFRPVLVTSDRKLEEDAVTYYREIKASTEIDEEDKDVLLEVFVSWLTERFKNKSRKEIEAMLLGELPELEETRAGKELIEIGEKRGEQRGFASLLLKLLAKRFGPVPAEIENRLRELSVEQLASLGESVLGYDSLDDVKQWLAGSKTDGSERT